MLFRLKGILGVSRLGRAHVRLIVVVLALTTVVLGAAILSWWVLALLATTLLQIVLIVLVVQARHVISRRVFAVARQLEGRISKAGARTQAKDLISPLASTATRKDSPTTATAPGAAPKGGRPTTQAATSDMVSASLILASGIFDKEWYELQVAGRFSTTREACEHYLSRGRRSGFSPHPLFLPKWIQKDWQTAAVDPLVKYLSDPTFNRNASTHPLFDPAYLDDRDRAAVDREWGALPTFLARRGAKSPLPYGPEKAAFRPGVTFAELKTLLMQESRNWREREVSYVPLRGSGTAPTPPANLADILKRFENREITKPKVSIILPTWNRAAKLRSAIESVQNQSYSEWELIVADDGSVDDTVLAVRQEALRDERIVCLELAHQGVSAARNRAIEASTGKYVAFLDSDKVWDPDFLLVMVSSMEEMGIQAAASACEVQIGDRKFFRSVQPTRESLAIGNSIDQTALVVRADTLRSTGGFDEGLRRAVDYDLILSVSTITDIHQIQFVGVRYSEDATDPNRISEAESVAWNFFVSDRRKWDAFEASASNDLVADRLTVIVDGIGSFDEAAPVIENFAKHRGTQDLELLLVLSGNYWADINELAAIKLSLFPVRLVYQDPVRIRPLVINEALRQATGEFVLFSHANQRIFEGGLDAFVSRFEDSEASVSHPVVLDSTRLIANAGIVYGDMGHDPVPLLAGVPLDGLELECGFAVPGAPLPLLTSTRLAQSTRGVNAKIKALWADIDFSQRLARNSHGTVCIDTELSVQQVKATPFDRHPKALADIRMFRELWPEVPAGSRKAIASTGFEATVAGFSASSNPNDPDKWPTLQLTRPRVEITEGRPNLRWAIKSAAPADDRSLLWGDHHFANSLATALRGLGQNVSVDYQENSARGTANLDDVVLNLRGLRDIALPATTLNLLWVISHPEDVTASEVSKYHVAYAASDFWAQEQSQQWGTEIRPLLQCSDSGLFYPEFDDEMAAANEILFVGNSRNTYRPAPWHVARVGLPIRIYGGGWTGLVPQDAIGGSYIPNDELRRFYSSAGYTLNDHWPDMRENGFISNRIFDVVAAGGRVLTDEVKGLSEVFGSEVTAFRDPVHLLSILNEPIDSKLADRQIALAASARIRRDHSFEARAGTLLNDALDYRRKANW